jgi:hypothetical protein
MLGHLKRPCRENFQCAGQALTLNAALVVLCPTAFFAAKVSQTIPFNKDSANYIGRAKLCKHFFAFSCRLMPESP